MEALTAKEVLFLQSLTGKTLEGVIEAALATFREKEAATSRLAEMENDSHEMALQFAQMRDELRGARAELAALREQNLHLAGVRTLQDGELFGRSTERAADILGGKTGIGLADPLGEDAPIQDGSPRQEKGAPDASAAKSRARKRPRKKKAAGKRERDLSDLPVCRVFEYDIDALNGQFGEGGWRFAFWHEHKSVELVRQYTYLKVTYTPVVSYGLEHCMYSVPYDGQLMQKSLASPSLVAGIMDDKYRLFLPLYRQEHDPGRFSLPISRQTMSNWVDRLAHELFFPVFTFLCDILRGRAYQQCDETTYLVIRDGRSAGTKSFIWAHRTSELLDCPPVIVFCYEETREAGHLIRFYKGQEGHVFLTCDAYAAYPALEKAMPGRFTICGCFMHARRRFVKALALVDRKGLPAERADNLPEAKGVELIGDIYREDEALKELSADARKERRHALVKPKVDAFFRFVNDFDADDPLVSEKLKDAILYSRKQEACLRRFLDDGNIPIDDGATERCIRPIAQGRHSYLFSYSKSGAEATAIISSLIETAKANGSDSYYYLKYLLERMPRHIYDKQKGYLAEMTPWSQEYRMYEAAQKKALADRHAPPGMEKPRTPRKRKKT